MNALGLLESSHVNSSKGIWSNNKYKIFYVFFTSEIVCEFICCVFVLVLVVAFLGILWKGNVEKIL
jgi:hypothetical protein